MLDSPQVKQNLISNIRNYLISLTGYQMAED